MYHYTALVTLLALVFYFVTSAKVARARVKYGVKLPAISGDADFERSYEAPLADRMAVEAAMAFIDVVRQQELDRLRVCDASDCADVLIDLSKNRSRRYCSTTCQNRTNVAAFRARRR